MGGVGRGSGVASRPRHRKKEGTPSLGSSSTKSSQENKPSSDNMLRQSCLTVQLKKTKFCIYYVRGACQYGTECAFAHSESELKATPDLRKTRLCAAFMNGQGCTNELCPFAHGEDELRSTDMFYKKSLCIWHEKGKCRNGDQCRFAHGMNELRDHCETPPPEALRRLRGGGVSARNDQKKETPSPPPGLHDNYFGAPNKDAPGAATLSPPADPGLWTGPTVPPSATEYKYGLHERAKEPMKVMVTRTPPGGSGLSDFEPRHFDQASVDAVTALADAVTAPVQVNSDEQILTSMLDPGASRTNGLGTQIQQLRGMIMALTAQCEGLKESMYEQSPLAPNLNLGTMLAMGYEDHGWGGEALPQPTGWFFDQPPVLEQVGMTDHHRIASL